MSEFTNARLKKNAQIAEALSTIGKKDLYSWKPSSNLRSNAVKLSNSPSNTSINNLSSPIFPAPPPKLKSLDLVIKRTTSLKDLQQNSSHKNPARIVSGTTRLKKLEFNLDEIDQQEQNEFITSFKSKSNLSDEDDDRPYLNSSRDGYIKKFSSNESKETTLVNLMKKDAVVLTEIDLSQLNLTRIENLEKFKNLKILDLSCNQIEKLENLNFKFLNELRVYANRIESIQGLDMLKDLQSLQLQSNRIKQIDKGLSQLRRLEYLRLDQNELKTIRVSELATCSNLIYLNVSFNQLETIGFINSLPNLEEFYATNLRIKNLNDIDPNRLNKLSEIDLSNNQLSDSNLLNFKSIKTLKTLKISNNGLTSIANISLITSLKNLDLSKNRLEKIDDLCKLTQLETLDLSSNLIKQISSLNDLEELVELKIKDNPLESSQTDILNRLTRLKYLDDVCTSEDKSTKLINKKLDITTIEFDMKKFEQQMKNLSESFMNRFDQVKQYLDKIEVKAKQDESTTPAVLSARQSSKKKLMEALYYSKQLGDNQEPECKTS